MMTRSTVKFFKGMGLGLVVGGVAGMVGLCYMKKHKKGFKHNMSRALRNMSELVDSMNGMF